MILGANGRAGRVIARALSTREHAVILVGRDEDALSTLASTLQCKSRTVVAGDLKAIIAAIADHRPAVVVNTIGPFGETALPIIDGCPAGTHYLDLANEMQVFESMMVAEPRIKERRQCVVTGAGWGVLATESIVLKLCADQPPAKRVRIDNLASVKADGTLGDTVAATIVDNLSYGGRCYQDGRLKRVRMGYQPDRFAVPDGTNAVTGGASTADLEAARRASGASDIVAGAELAPTSPVIAALAGFIGALSRFGFIRRQLQRSFAKMPNTPPKRNTSWARAVVEWPGDRRRVGWLRAGDAYDFLAKASAETATRLADQKGKPGVYTPGGLFGAELAELAGAMFILEDAGSA
ncbi:NAD(P)H-binding protein [Labrys monachus]|uniref:Short subunit dehydrogenase-like uncharacterized protein n=1 Tax=Labrys monachus TaxID=217067 RepID=A0ABU0FGL7_9HYPH|nr:NAD(P)H-binding protein [Labrys monachus]MDQ0393758.1 short subunit dehydrogenase-like uncharacterized protein [Labrys monachus]